MSCLTGPAAEHPCFHGEAHSRFGRIHLPVAPRCNIQCVYCDRRYDCPNESRPGVTAKVITPEEALERTAQVLEREPRIRVAGVAGPGEPLYNPETFETFRRLRQRFPGLTLCVSTNGLLLPDRLEELLACGVSTLTVTINAITVETAGKLYDGTFQGLESLSRRAALEQLLACQQDGLKAAVQAGLAVKVNMVLIPSINRAEVPAIAEAAAAAGAVRMNIMPLIPCGRLSAAVPPTASELLKARAEAAVYLPQFTHCRQCRADACGVPGETSVPSFSGKKKKQKER